MELFRDLKKYPIPFNTEVLVLLKEPMCGLWWHTAIMSSNDGKEKNVGLIGGHFDYDAPEIVGYYILPQKESVK